MFSNLAIVAGIACTLCAPILMAEEKIGGGVTCADLRWSADVLAANPDIGRACRGVYVKDDVLYARAIIEIVRVSGNSMTFRTLRSDGSKGKNRRVTLDQNWRASIAGREYRVMDLLPGQKLDVYLPEDRFALTLAGEEGVNIGTMMTIEQEPVAAPQ